MNTRKEFIISFPSLENKGEAKTKTIIIEVEPDDIVTAESGERIEKIKMQMMISDLRNAVFKLQEEVKSLTPNKLG